jgi:NADH-quinone oxidoreductase subunit J
MSPMMPSYLFWIFSALTLGFACMVILNRNPVASALSLAVSFLGLAALFIGLDAHFLGIIQILVYAGAVMVLFLFIVMLLDLKGEAARQVRWPAVIGGMLVAALFIFQLVAVLGSLPGGDRPFPPLAGPIDDVRNVGATLFSKFNLPFQVVGILILVASVGVVVLGRRETRK